MKRFRSPKMVSIPLITVCPLSLLSSLTPLPSSTNVIVLPLLLVNRLLSPLHRKLSCTCYQCFVSKSVRL